MFHNRHLQKTFISFNFIEKANPLTPFPKAGRGKIKHLSSQERGTLRENAPRSWREVIFISADV